MPTRKPTKKAAEAPAAARRMHPDREPINPWQPTPLEAAITARDKVVSEVEGRWGSEVLETLVSPETAAKFASARLKEDVAVLGDDEEEAIRRVGVVTRGMLRLEEEAVQAGRKPLELERYWPATDAAGGRWLFVQTEADTKAAAKDPRWAGYQVWSLNEVMRVLNLHSLEAVIAAKKAFPEATVTAVKPEPDWAKGDPVPEEWAWA